MGAGENGAVEASESVGMGETIEGADEAAQRFEIASSTCFFAASFFSRLALHIAVILLFGIRKPKIEANLVTI